MTIGIGVGDRQEGGPRPRLRELLLIAPRWVVPGDSSRWSSRRGSDPSGGQWTGERAMTRSLLVVVVGLAVLS